MQALLAKYNNGVIPPFYSMPSIRVTYDELGYLSVTGDATSDDLEHYAAALLTGGWDYYVDTDYAGRYHVYGRVFVNGDLYEADCLVQNGIVSINYSFTFSHDDWPYQDIAAVLMEYESNAEVPVFAATTYIYEIDAWYNMSILCLGDDVDADSLAPYAELLKENRWSVTKYDIEGSDYYVCDSLDALTHLEFYFDGAGVVITLSHGEGEIYTSWEQCVPAIEDFLSTDLRLENPSLEIPSFDGGAKYEIGRNANGWLNIAVRKDGSYKQYETEKVYRSSLIDAGYTIDATKRNADTGYGYFAIPPQKDFAIMFLLVSDVNDNGDDANYFEISILDYRSYQGYYVSDSWPTAGLNTVLSHISASSVVIPGYNKVGATYYWTRNSTLTTMTIEIVDPGEDALRIYKEGLVDYDFSITENGENAFYATDEGKLVLIEATMVRGELHIYISKYIAPMTDGKIDFSTQAQIFDTDRVTYAVWGGNPYTFRVNTNGKKYISDYWTNPLRIYQGYTVILTPNEGKKMTEVSFYLADVYNGSTLASGFANSNLTDLTIAGATLTKSNVDLKKYTYTIDEAHQETGIQFDASLGGFGLSKIVVTVA